MTNDAWRPANNGAGKRPWFVVRGNGGPAADCYQWTKSGNLIRYGSCEAAMRAAARLNAAEALRHD